MQKPLIPALLFALLLTFGCGKSDDTPDNVDNWVIQHFDPAGDKDDNAAVLFTGYSFEFNTSDELIVHLPDGSTKPAKWALNAGQTKMTVAMENPFVPISSLLGEWTVKEYTATSILLELSPVLGTDPKDQGEEVHFVKQ